MNNSGLTRLIYSRGQMLTAQDFTDQQDYHREKQRQLLSRFPSGIIGGLEVECSPKGSEPGDFDGFKIKEGSAVDPAGNELIVPEGGLRVNIEPFDPEKPYLSLVYLERSELVGGGLCGGSQKNNRMVETVDYKWDPAPNMDQHITVALIQKATGPAATCFNKFREPMNPDVPIGHPTIRKNARVVDTEQITDNAVTDKKIKNGAVITEKIKDNAVVNGKLAKDAVTRDKIKDGEVVAGKLGPNAVMKENIKDGEVVEGKLGQNAVLKENIKNGEVVQGKLGPDAVTRTNILTGEVVAGKLGSNAVTRDNIKNGEVVQGKLGQNAVLGDNIQNGEVVVGKLGPNAVVRNNIKDGEVVAGKLGADAVRKENLKDGEVVQGKLGPNAVLMDNIRDENVTSSKLKVITPLLTNITLSQDDHIARTLTGVSPNAILHVVPTNQGELSWTFTVKGRADGALDYTVTIRNIGPGTVAFDVKQILFN